MPNSNLLCRLHGITVTYLFQVVLEDHIDESLFEVGRLPVDDGGEEECAEVVRGQADQRPVNESFRDLPLDPLQPSDIKAQPMAETSLQAHGPQQVDIMVHPDVLAWQQKQLVKKLNCLCNKIPFTVFVNLV